MTSDSTIDAKRQDPGSARGGRFVPRLAGLASGAGCVAVLAFVSQASSWAEYARTVAGLLMVAGCAWALGALVGFLFGIPRTLSSPSDEPSLAGGRGDEFVHYRVNTNLEQISDWLTKILVGVGLAELHRLPAAVGGAADYFAASIGGRAAADLAGFVVALLVYFSIVGLMTGYLGTRVLLAPLFKLADRKHVHPGVDTVSRR
jgi:hypothetical protein